MCNCVKYYYFSIFNSNHFITCNILAMRYCEVEGCNNSSIRGFKMCHFPTSSNRRQKWIEFVGRAGWTPKKYSTLCEIHFDKNMWENEQIFGKKKLKLCAVPTIFLRPPAISPATVLNRVWNRSILRVNCNSSSVDAKSLLTQPLVSSPKMASSPRINTSQISIDNNSQQTLLMNADHSICDSNRIVDKAKPQNDPHDVHLKEINMLKKIVNGF
ncbi:THAP domain-containing protein 4-like [Ceratina calcarata]|uniref:THAP domain-containing protein 4-like n=1 Tax=Ceratina calcarata TaxID=156304 RepID=A0AAJ7JGW2_9HYME|nr:THAP domain-containing protein 4-like [Ceratina calcarata]